MQELEITPVVPPQRNRLAPWDYDHPLSKKRHEVERLFRRFKGFGRLYSRFEQLELMFALFVHFAIIVESLKSVNSP